MSQVIDPDGLIRMARVSRKEAVDWYKKTGKMPILGRDLPRVKELYARYVNCRGVSTVTSLMHWDNEGDYWEEIANALPDSGVKITKASIHAMAALIEYCIYNPYYDFETGALTIPEEPIEVDNDMDTKIWSLVTWAKELQAGKPYEPVRFIMKWYEEFYP